MSAAAELFVKVSADVKGLTRGMDDAAAAIDQVAEEAKKAEQPLARFRDIVGGVAAGELLADGLRSAAQAMVSLGTRSLQLAGELEQNQVAFTTMLGSADKANKMLADLATFAASTPFELRGLTDSAKKLIAFGFSSQSIIPIMTSLGDAIGGIGGGQEAIGQVTMALGQMAAKGKVSAEEMNQFAEKGINTWKYVAQAIGKSVPEAMKLAEKGAIDAATAIPAILQGMSKEFGGMMEKQSKTWNGALSNFQDATDQAMTKIGDAIIRMGLGELIQKMTAGVNNLAAAFDSGRIIPAIQATEAAVLGLATAFTAYLLPGARVAGASMVTAFTAGAAAAAPFIALAAAVAFAAYPIIKNWQEIKWGLQDLFDYGMGKMTQFYNYGSGIVRDFANNWLTGMNYIAGVIRSVLGDTIADKLIGGVKAIGSAFAGMPAKVAPAMQALRGLETWALGDGRTMAGNFRETWSDAMASAKLVTVDLFKTTAAGKVDVAKITAELLGLKKAGASADDLKKKADELAKAQAKAAREAAKHRRELDAQYKAAQASYDKFEAMAMALGTVSRGLAQAEAEAARLGRSFDLAGAKAAVIKDGLGQVESAFGKFSPQAVNLRTQLFELQQQSANGGKATAEAFKALDGASLSIEQARLAAQLLGTEFDASSTAANEYKGAITSLIQQGLKPGNPILDEAVKKYRDAAAAVDAAKFAALPWYEQLKAGVGAVRDIVGAVDEMASVFGLSLPPALLKAINGGLTFANALVSIISVIPTVINAVNAMAVALSISTGGVYAILVGITALAAGAIYLYETMTQAEQAAKKLDETLRNSVSTAVGGALRAGAQAFADGAANYQEIMRTKLREGIIAGVLDAVVNSSIITGMGELIAKVARAMREGTQQEFMVALEELRQETEKTFQSFTGRMDQLLQGVRAVLPETNLLAGRVEKYTQDAAKARREASGAADDAGEKRVSVNESHQQAIMRTLERMAADDPRRNVLLAQLRVLQGRASASDLATVQPGSGSRYSLQPLPGMATGGLVTGPVVARMGEGGRNEAVLPLNENVYRQIGEGIAAARGGGSGVQLVVNYSGSGKWTREDAQGLGRLLVSELRSMGVRA